MRARPAVAGHGKCVRDDQVRELTHQRAKRTAVEQGLPPKVEEIAVLRHVLYLMGFPSTRAAGS